MSAVENSVLRTLAISLVESSYFVSVNEGSNSVALNKTLSDVREVLNNVSELTIEQRTVLQSILNSYDSGDMSSVSQAMDNAVGYL